MKKNLKLILILIKSDLKDQQIKDSFFKKLDSIDLKGQLKVLKEFKLIIKAIKNLKENNRKNYLK